MYDPDIPMIDWGRVQAAVEIAEQSLVLAEKNLSAVGGRDHPITQRVAEIRREILDVESSIKTQRDIEEGKI